MKIKSLEDHFANDTDFLYRHLRGTGLYFVLPVSRDRKWFLKRDQNETLNDSQLFAPLLCSQTRKT